MTPPNADEPTRSVHINTERTWRGGEKQTLLLMQGLLARDQVVALIAQPGSPLAERARDVGVKVHEIAMRAELDLFAARNIRRVMHRGEFQICQMHTSHAHTLGVIARGRATFPRTIVARRVDFSIHRRGLSGKLGINALKYRTGVDRYIAISEAIKRVMVSDGIPDRRITVVHSGVPDLPAPCSTPAEIRARHGIPGDAPIIGNVAHLAGHKGQIHLVEAARRLREDFPEVRTLIVGEGDERPPIEAAIRAAGLEDRVILAGFQKDIPAYLHTFTIFVMPSLQEGLCTSLLDALRCRLPLVGSRTGGIPEIVHDEETGLLAEAGDAASLEQALRRLLADRELRERLAERGHRLAVEEFSSDHTVEGTLRVYRDLIREATS